MKKKYITRLTATILIATACCGAQTTSVPRVQVRNWGPQFAAIQKLFGQVSNDREELKAMRQKHISAFNALRKTANPDYVLLSRSISSDTINFVNNIFTQTLEKMKPKYGPPPTKFCIFTLGSLARLESGFYTDLEIGILVEKLSPAIQAYFTKFAQKVSDRLFLLGEHPDVGGKGLRIDEEANAPIHFKWNLRWASTQEQTKALSAAKTKDERKKILGGSRLFLTTPEVFATFMAPAEKRTYPSYMPALTEDEHKIAEATGKLSRNIKYLYGDKALYDEYLRLRERILAQPVAKPTAIIKNRRHEIAVNKMLVDLKDARDRKNSPIPTGKLGSTVDLKRQLYRFPEQVLTNLGFYFNLNTQNISAITKQLIKQDFISQSFGNELTDLVNYVIGLRLKQQAKMRKQGFAIDVTGEEYFAHKQKLINAIRELKQQDATLARIPANQSRINDIFTKINELKSDIKDLERTKPGQTSSILSPDEIQTLNSKYLPILQKLYRATDAFTKGNLKAFSSDVKKAAQPQRPAQPQRKPAPKSPVKPTAQPIASPNRIAELQAQAKKIFSPDLAAQQQAIKAREELIRLQGRVW